MIDWSIVKHGTRSHRGTHFADSSESNKTLWYIDANNLYGCAMMKNLPYKDFEYFETSLDEGETTLQRILNTPDNIDHGYYIAYLLILFAIDIDINGTNSCKDRTEKLALMPHKREINDNDLGYRERGKGRARTEKFISDQNNKKEYMVHYRMLKFYVKMGLRVTKIHRVIKFKQDYICRDYLQNSTNKRATAKTEAEK